MRRAIFQGDEAEGRSLLAAARAIHIATIGAEGQPILRVVHPVIVRVGDADVLAFHAAPAGEKMEAIGRPAVVSAHEVVAEIPSWFLDPERACPATTFYVSAQADGIIEEIDDLETKARVLQTLMTKYQPEGGHVPIRGEDPLYTKAVRGLLVAGIRLDRVVCKAKLGQNRRLEERRTIVEKLWQRGAPGDVRAVHTLVSRFPELAPSSFLEGGLRFSCAVGDDDIGELEAILEGAYWLESIPKPRVLAAIRASQAVVLARDEKDGSLVAFARAVSDGRTAWIYDVIVRPDARGSGAGTHVMRFLQDHPAVRDALYLRLTTKDAMPFYRRLGYAGVDEVRRHAWASTEMIRPRSQNACEKPSPAKPDPSSGTTGELAAFAAALGAVR